MVKISYDRQRFPLVTYLKDFEQDVDWKDQPYADWIHLDEIPKVVQEALLVSEDWSFYDHPGVDFKQIRKAVGEAIRSDSSPRGASTISQQVTRIVYLSRKRSFFRKIIEAVLALWLDLTWGKKRILEIYFNTADWGDDIVGIKQASHFYFDKQPKLLTPKESAFLMMLLPSPQRYAISFRQKELTEYASQTILKILNFLKIKGVLSEEELILASEQQLFQKIKDEDVNYESL